MVNVNEECHEFLLLEEIHDELLKLLLRFDAFCREHGLRYSLDSGTLLGAVRHKGFIPWDDDIDVSMPRPDYERLLSMEDELPEGLHLVNAGNSDFPFAFSKFCTDEIRVREPLYEGVMDEMLWVDVFPMDGVPSDIREMKRSRRRVLRAVRRNISASVNHFDETGVRRIIKSVGGFLFRFGNPKERMLKAIDAAASSPGYDAAELLGCPVGTEGFAWSVPKTGYEEFIEMEFEGRMFPCMSCWDEFLVALYGDYMQLPPEDQRRTHCVKAWRP